MKREPSWKEKVLTNQLLKDSRGENGLNVSKHPNNKDNKTINKDLSVDNKGNKITSKDPNADNKDSEATHQ